VSEIEFSTLAELFSIFMDSTVTLKSMFFFRVKQSRLQSALLIIYNCRNAFTFEWWNLSGSMRLFFKNTANPNTYTS